MAHIWNVIDGDIYVSKNGDDVAGDGSMAAPYASINKATDVGAAGDKIVIGTGVWEESRGTSANQYSYIGDGDVIFTDKITYFKSTIHDEYFENIQFIYTNRNPLIYRNRAFFKKCYLFNTWFDFAPNELITYTNCVIEKLYTYTTVTNACNVIANNCIFIGESSIGSKRLSFINLQNSIFYRGSFPYDPTIPLTGVSTNVTYEWGNPINNSIEINPKFNNAEIGDYTLKPDSPCLFAGANNANIGAFGLGYSFDANSSEFTKEGGAIFSQTISDDIIRTQQTVYGITRFLFQLNAGHTSGSVESAWIDLQAIRYLLITRLFANYIYNTSGVATSRPDNLESVGEKAVYYDFELKYCNEESEKAAATFKNVIWNKAVTIDNSNRGNADPAFVASEAKYISARFIKIKLYMTEA